VPVIERRLRPRVLEALEDTRVVAVLGARQVGKSTLVQSIAGDEWPATVLTLDDQATRDAATSDPTGFVAGLSTPVVIDEVQRVPTGSANIVTAPRIADALTGRAEYLRPPTDAFQSG
jgi:predicted AAA+ superfamily ATPase